MAYFRIEKKRDPLYLTLIKALIIGLLAGCATDPTSQKIIPPHCGAIKNYHYEPFAWGVSTSSLQYENSGVQPQSINAFKRDWDSLIQKQKAPPIDGALWSWSHFHKDLQALEKMHLNAYRFSIEWARVEPQPGRYNQKAIDHYVAMVKELKAAGIEPYVCLWHFSFPAWLTATHKGGGSNWLYPGVRQEWKHYVTKMVRALSPYVTYYAPQNEPNGQILTAYIAGLWPPNHTLDFRGYDAAMSASIGMFRDAATIIKREQPHAKILSIEAIPYWYHGILDPADVIYHTVEGNAFEHLDGIYDSCDIIGFNYYYSQVAGPISLLTESSRRGPRFTMMGWRIDPKAFGRLLVKVASRYGKPIMITENGIATENETKRIDYLQAHLAQIAQAMQQGYDIRGYFIWSLADNYEWHYGYEPKFGLTYLDPQRWKLQFKESAYYYRAVIDASKKEKKVVPLPSSFSLAMHQKK